MPELSAVLTPDKTIVTREIALLQTRFWAQLLDAICITGLIMIISTASALLFSFVPFAEAGMVVFSVAFPFLYFIVLEGAWSGQTIGKRVAGIQVIMGDGTPITWRAAIFRNLLRLADFLPFLYGVGVIASFLNPHGKRLGDIAVDTLVVTRVPLRLTFHPAPHRFGVHPLEDEVGHLRGVTLEEYYTLKRLCDRYTMLPPETQTHLVETVWVPFAKRHRLPESTYHPILRMEAVVMKYGRQRELI